MVTLATEMLFHLRFQKQPLKIVVVSTNTLVQERSSIRFPD